MRIALLTFEYPDARPGGVGAYVYRIARAFGAAGHEAHIFTLTLPADARKTLPQGVYVHEVTDIAEQIVAWSLSAALGAAALNGGVALYKLVVGGLLAEALRREHEKRAFDVVEAAEYEGLGVPLMMRPVAGLPVVTQIHLSTAVGKWANGEGVTEGGELAEAVELAAIVGADAVCAATSSIVEVTRRVMPFEREVEVIPHPLEAAVDATEPPGEGPILFVGRLQKRKGCEVLAEAGGMFLKKFRSAVIRVAGSDTPTGPGGTSMREEMIRRLDPEVRERFMFLGELSGERVRAEIKSCLFTLAPSHVENFATTATEALGAGRAVVYGGQTGLDDVVGDAGLRVWPLTAENLAAAMERLYTQRELLLACSRRAAERVRKVFPLDVTTRQRVAFYERVIAGHRETGRVGAERFRGMPAGKIAAVMEALAGPRDTGGAGQTRTAGVRVVEILERLRGELGRVPVVWLFGAGRHTVRLMGERYVWESRGFTVAGVIDDHPRFAGEERFLGMAVRTTGGMEAAVEGGEKVDAVVLSTDTLVGEFWEKTEGLRRRGVETVRLY